jgi:hypothetical protein
MPLLLLLLSLLPLLPLLRCNHRERASERPEGERDPASRAHARPERECLRQ